MSIVHQHNNRAIIRLSQPTISKCITLNMKSLGYSIKFLNITNNDHIIHNSFKKHASFERYFHKIVVPFFKREKKFMLQTKYFTVLPSSWKKECTFFLLLLLKKGKSEMVFSQIQKSLKYCKEYLHLHRPVHPIVDFLYL